MKRMWVGFWVAATLATLPASVLADVCQPCSEKPKDPKVPGRSLKSYWGVAHQTQTPDTLVLAKAFDQGHLALCGEPDQWEWNMFMGMVSAELDKAELAGCYFTQAHKQAKGKGDLEKVENNSGHYWVEHYNQSLSLFGDQAFEAALEQSSLAIAIAPDSCKAYAIKGSALINLGRHAEAVQALEKGAKLCPQDESYKANLFTAFHNQGNDLFNRAVAASKDSSRALYAEAASWYERADQLNPDLSENNYQLGMTNLQLKNLGDSTRAEGAKKYLERYVAKSEDKKARLSAIYHLAVLEIEAKNWAKAGEYADRYIAEDPRDADGYRLKANIGVNSGSEDAEKFIIFSRGKPVDNADAWLASSKHAATSDLSKLVKEKGKPEEIRTFTDKNGNSMDSLFYWSKGEGYAFYGGQKRGTVTFPAQTP
jgi:tetratricopeptide (TPR) repeat protein